MEISRDDALALLADREAVTNHLDVSSRAMELDERNILSKLRAEERQNIIDMRRDWSVWVLRCIVAIVATDILGMFLLGFHVLSFDSQWFVPTFIADSLVKVLGLAFIIVRFLFGKESVGGYQAS